MKKVIWLCSWYPSEVDAFIGDFVQRQAEAVARFVDVEVVHVAFGEGNHTSIERDTCKLTEHFFYLPQKNRALKLIQYMHVHDNFLKNYRSRKGKPDWVHVHIPMKAGLVAMKWKLAHQIPYVVTEHYGIYNQIVEDNFSTRSFFFQFMTKQIFKKASLFLAVSEAIARDVKREVADVKHLVVSNVVNTDYFFYEGKEQSTNKFTFCHVSSLAQVKNPEGLLEAIRKLSMMRTDFRFNIIGSTNKDFEAKAVELNLLNSIIFIEKEKSYREVALANQQANAGVLFSHSENQPCVILEWLCCGLPVISSDVGGVSEIITESNGILIKPNDVDALVNAMNLMMNQYQQYSQRDIAKAAQHSYSYQAVGQQIAKVYDMDFDHG